MPNIFISYTTNDKPFAKKLESFLTSAGVDVWLDDKRLQVGDSLIKKISEGINASKYVVAVLSKSSVKSKWFQNEILWALTKERELGRDLILPVVIEDCEIPSFLKDKHFINFGNSSSGFIESMNKLLDKLEIAPDLCQHCNFDLPVLLERCPHCARCGPAPNVRAARVPVERKALDSRYQRAISDAISRGCGGIVSDFETALTESRAVINRSKKAVLELIKNQGMPSHYYQLIESESGQAGGWALLRELADTILFGGQKAQIRFAALSLNGKGLSNYGECALVLRDELIAHRASVFQENSSLFMERQQIKISRRPVLPPGYRAAWNERGKLCVAKLAGMITPNTKSRDFSTLVLRSGATPDEDEFIEVHIWGPLTVRAVEHVIVSSRIGEGRSNKALTRTLCDTLERIGVPVILEA